MDVLIPISGLSFVLDAIIYFAIYFIVRHHAKSLQIAPSVKYWEIFFLNMGIFLTIMVLPYIFLYTNPAMFSGTAALALVLGRIPLFIAIASTARLFTLFIWRTKTNPIYYLWLAIGAAIFVVHIFLPSHPVFDPVSQITIQNTHPLIAKIVPIYVTITWLPLAILFFVNGIKNPATRTRSFLLALGLVTQMIAGPLHNIAQSAQISLLADGLTLISNSILLLGVLHKSNRQENTPS